MDDSSSTVETPTHSLSLCTRLAYSVGHILNDLCASMWFSYLLVYLHYVLQFNNNTAGILMLTGQIADGVATPFVGIESDKIDNFWLCRYGRRKTWHLLGTICVLVSFPFLFSKCFGCSEAHEGAQLVYYAAFIIIFQFGWASVQISHLSLIPDLTPVSSERVELNSLRYAFTVASNISVYVITWVFLGAGSTDKDHYLTPSDAPLFRNITLTVLGVGFLFSVTFHIFVKEKKPQTHPQTASDEVDFDLDHLTHLTWKEWFREPQFYQIGLLYMGTRLYVNLSQVYTPLYLQDSLKLETQSIAIIPLVIYVSGFLSSLFVTFINRKLGSKVTYLFGVSSAIGASVWLYFGRGDLYRYREVYAVAVLIGIGGSTMLVTSLSITSDLIGKNTSSGAFVFGAMSFLDKLSNGLAVLIIQDVHPCIWCCEDCQWYYQYVMVFACGGSAVFALIMLATLSRSSIGVKQRRGIARSNRADKEIGCTSAGEYISRNGAKGPPCTGSQDDSDTEPLISCNDVDEHITRNVTSGTTHMTDCDSGDNNVEPLTRRVSIN
ncbi:major facilitator superfamily domain-containing protein 12-like isoform X1 [Tachypleus tridentatus]|uniref:major facilitator superfamily domain-containing protein 12-like isoform X1 n=1 Tax=Tachypleus tridentatus TaxID=6853 RepID=UPI003FD22C69